MSLSAGDRIELKVTPDPYVTYRYAGASGDFNPIHIDEDFAKQVGLPGRILHGLWTMAQVARALTEAAGGPETLKELKVEFRGMGQLGEEITVSGQLEAGDQGQLTASLEAVQAGKRIIRNAVATLRSD
jgi:acyl dehydratase